MALTQVTSVGVKDGELVNADINSSAAITYSKLANISANRVLGRTNAGAVEATQVHTGMFADDSVTFAKMNNISADRIIGRVGGGTGDIGTLTAAQTRSFLGLAASATTDTTNASNISSGTVAAARLDTATTQSAGNNSTKIATTAYADTAISNLVDSSPSALNTLNELAAALGDDANFSTTVTNSIATKLPLAGGTLTGALQINGVLTTNGTHNFLQGSSSSNSTITLKKSASGADNIDYLQCRNSSNTLIAKIGGSGDIHGSGANITALNANNISSGVINTNRFGNSTISRVHIQDNAINGDKIADSSITSTKILNDSIVNADINSSAAIAGTKISSDFGSQNIVTTGNVDISGFLRTGGTYPRVYLTDSDNDSDYVIINDNGNFVIRDDTNGSNRLTIVAGGTATFSGNQTTNGNITIENADPKLILKDSNNTGNGSQNSLQGVDSNGNQDWIIGNYTTTESTLFIKNNRNASTKFTAAVSGDTWEIYGNSGHFAPCSDNAVDLGTSSKRVRNIYTADLNLSNKGSSNDVDGTWGQYTIQEGEDDLFLLNRRNGKKYKFNLTEVN